MLRVDWLVTELNIVGGAETFVRRVAPRMRQAGWDLRVVTLVAGGRLVEELRREGVPVIELGLRHKADLLALARLAGLWREDPPHLVHTHLYHAGLVGRLTARRTGVRVVVVHQHGAERARSPLRSLLDRLTTPLATCYVASCQAVARILQTRERIPRRRIAVIYNGLDLAGFDLPGPEAPSPPAWPVPPGVLSAGTIGRLSHEKGQAYLLEALAQPALRGLDLHVVLVGEGRSRAELEERCNQLGLAGRAHFAGPQQNVLPWLRRFDLFVLPSEWEGISLALLEAMASRLPVIATRAGGTPEVVLHEETGLLVPPCDPLALAGAIARLAIDPDLRLRLGDAGYERVLRSFSLNETVQRLDRLYQILLGESTESYE